jgi:hypothetical protein
MDGFQEDRHSKSCPGKRTLEPLQGVVDSCLRYFPNCSGIHNGLKSIDRALAHERDSVNGTGKHRSGQHRFVKVL